MDRVYDWIMSYPQRWQRALAFCSSLLIFGSTGILLIWLVSHSVVASLILAIIALYGVAYSVVD